MRFLLTSLFSRDLLKTEVARLIKVFTMFKLDSTRSRQERLAVAL